MTALPLVRICHTLDIGRATAYRMSGPRGPYYHRSEDRVVTAQIRAVIRMVWFPCSPRTACSRHWLRAATRRRTARIV